jgi:phosphoribosyl 1,2-cyclic phosphate phosphodiesterase
MEIEIVGSGGAIVTPRPGCHCPMCDEAREKGVPYARRGPVVFVHGPDILFDTPEDITVSLNESGIERVRACFYSHWHPDHVMGRRVFEQLNWNLRDWSGNYGVTDIYIPERVEKDMQKMLATRAHLDYMQSLDIVRITVIPEGESVEVDGVTVTPFPVAVEYVYAYLLQEGETRVLVAMDELVGWSAPEDLHGIDLAVLPSGVCEHHPLTGERRIEADHPVLTSEMRLEETLEVIRAMAPKRAVLMHIDEVDGISHDDGLELSRRYREDGLPVDVGWDGLRIAVEDRFTETTRHYPGQ